jgi:hypothetical protein
MSHHFASIHITALHSPFFTSLHFWTFRHHPSKTLHFFYLIISFLTLFIKICDLQGKVASASAGSRFPLLFCLIPGGVRYERQTGNAVGSIMGVNKQPQRLGLVRLLSCTGPIPKTIGLILLQMMLKTTGLILISRLSFPKRRQQPFEITML